MYEIKAIPTRYNGAQFRSRLEARWAAFFDLVGIKWEYEPFDVNGWAPDFLLIGEKHELLVEVKPTIDEQAAPFQKALRFGEQLGEDFKRDRRIMCVGVSPLIKITIPNEEVTAFAFSEDCYFSFYEGGGKIDIAVCWGGVWSTLLGRETSGWKDAYARHPQSIPIVERLWREASNLTQWRR